MSIFILMPTLEDSETEFTIKDAYEMADNPNEIYFGIACTTEDEYYNNLLFKVSNYNNVKIKKLNPSKQYGAVNGRRESFSFYNNQDYVLQMDSHVCFKKSWDSILINLYNEAKNETKNNKTVLTCFMPGYKHKKNGERYFFEDEPKYGFFTLNNYSPIPQYLKIPKFTAEPFKKTPIVRTEKFLPSVKVNSHFLFGDKEFAESDWLKLYSHFWEDDFMSTIVLIDKGFSLVFPNTSMPLAHLYNNDTKTYDSDSVSERQELGHILKKYNIEDKNIINDNYLSFIQDPNNSNILKKFHKYTKVHPKHGAAIEWYIPSDYNR